MAAGTARCASGGPPPRLLSALSLLRHPRELDSEGLGRAATAAVREGLDDESWWKAFRERALELAPRLALHDAALVLNSMARVRRTDRKLVMALLPRISSHLVYLTSAHLAMLASAIAKSGVHDATFAAALTRELKARLMEFQTSMEITMIVNAMSKLRVTDEDLYRRFVSHIQNAMGHEVFHVRDLSVLVGALARVQCTDNVTMSRFADCAVATLPEATPMELARLMHAYMSVGCVLHDFFGVCAHYAKQRALTMDPGGLTNAAFAFGQCFEVADEAHYIYLRRIFRAIRKASVASLPLYLPREIVSLLRTYARWQVAFNIDQLRRVAERMRATAQQFDAEGAVSASYSLGVLMQRNAGRSQSEVGEEVAWTAAAAAARSLLAPVWSAARRGDVEVVALLRAIEAAVSLQATDAEIPRTVAAVIARRSAELDAPTCSALYEFLNHMGVSQEEDVMLALADGARASMAPPTPPT